MRRALMHCFVLMLSAGLLWAANRCDAQPSPAEQIIGGILQQLADDAAQQQGVPRQGVWANRWSNVPVSGNSTIRITNEGHQPLRLGFARPNGGGTSVAAVPPHAEYTKTGLARGTQVSLQAPSGVQNFVLSGDSMSITVTADGRVLASSNAGGGGGAPAPPQFGSIVVTNRSNQPASILVTPADPRVMGAYTDLVPRGGQWIKDSLPVDTKVNVEAAGRRTFNIEPGTLRITVRSDGRIVSGQDSGGWGPVGPGGDTAGVIVTNQTSANVRITLRQRFSNRESVAVVVPGDVFSRDNLNDGTRVTLSGSIPPETVTLSGGRVQQLTILPNGQVAIGNRPGNSDPPAGRAGDVEVANRSGQPIVANFGISTKTVRHNSAHTFIGLEAGRVVQITGNGATATFTHTGRRVRVTVLPNGQFDDLPPLARVTTEPTYPDGGPITPPDDPPLNPPINPPDGTTNPDPPRNTDPPPTAPSNGLPAPDAAPLRESVVARFARKTNDECIELIDLLDAGSSARIDSLATAIQKAGVEAGGVGQLKQAARQGDTNRVEQLVGQFDNATRSDLADEFTTLASITKIRGQLLELKQKISTGASSTALRGTLNQLAGQATNLGDDGLTAAVGRIRRDLLIRDTVSRGLEITGVGPSQLALPQGEVNVISHPWISKGNTYFAESGLLLIGSDSPQVLVAKMQAVDALQLPVAKAGAEAIPDADNLSTTPQIVVSNPPDTRTKLGFKIAGESYSLAAGEQQAFPVGPKHIIEFSRGSSGQVARFDISQPGIYAFSAGGEGWQLARQRVDIELSSPKHGGPLVYVIDGTAETLLPGETSEHSSSGPILLFFDRGEGDGTIAKRLASDGEYHFAIDPASGYWNLFGGPAPAAPKAGSDVVRIDRPTLNEIKAAVDAKLFDFAAAADDEEDDLLNELRE